MNTEGDYERDYQAALPQGRTSSRRVRYGLDDRKRERSFSGLSMPLPLFVVLYALFNQFTSSKSKVPSAAAWRISGVTAAADANEDDDKEEKDEEKKDLSASASGD